MPPNQNQFPAPQNSGDPEHDPYAFFMEPQKPSKGSLFGGGSNKLFIIAGAVVALLVIVVVIVMASSANKGKTDELLAVVQAQQEVIRVATDGTKNAHSTTLKNFANTTAVSSDDNPASPFRNVHGVRCSAAGRLLHSNGQVQNPQLSGQTFCYPLGGPQAPLCTPPLPCQTDIRARHRAYSKYSLQLFYDPS
jgi:hypothetical protein